MFGSVLRKQYQLCCSYREIRLPCDLSISQRSVVASRASYSPCPYTIVCVHSTDCTSTSEYWSTRIKKYSVGPALHENIQSTAEFELMINLKKKSCLKITEIRHAICLCMSFAIFMYLFVDVASRSL